MIRRGNLDRQHHRRLLEARPGPPGRPARADIDYILEELWTRTCRTRIAYATTSSGVLAGLRPLVAQAGQQNAEKLAGDRGSPQVRPRIRRRRQRAPPLPRHRRGCRGRPPLKDDPARGRQVHRRRNPVIGAHALGTDRPAERPRRQSSITEDQVEHLLNRGSLISDCSYAKRCVPREAITNAEGYLRVEAILRRPVEGALHLEDVVHHRTRISIDQDDRGMDRESPTCGAPAPAGQCRPAGAGLPPTTVVADSTPEDRRRREPTPCSRPRKPGRLRLSDGRR
ncbi:MAG: hypothetical protein U1U88_001158 [Lawsonella clevelandensis]